jgi:hypothetical protein
MWTWFSVSDWHVQPLHKRLTLHGIHGIFGDIAVGLATGWTTEGSRVRVSVGSIIFSSPKCPDRLLRPTQPPIQWVTGALFRSKAAGAWNLPFISNECRGQANVDLYTHCPIPLRGLVLYWLSVWTLSYLYGIFGKRTVKAKGKQTFR